MPSSVSWTLNDEPFAALGIDDATVSLVNGAGGSADTLVMVQTLEDNDASASPFSWGDEVILKRDGVVWFVGTVRDIDESVARARTITARGGWDVLERKAYLQTFAAAADPSDPLSSLVTVQRGRVVLGQGDDGLRLPLATFITQVLTYAGVTVGTIDAGGITVPFEDATDLSCAEVIQRLLRWIPTCVLWFDYATGEAVCNLAPRSGLTPTTLTIGAGEGVTWQTPLRLRPRYDLKVDHVALFYIATNRSNASSWEVVLPDNGPGNPPGAFYPEGTTGEEPGALVRTIELGGSIDTRSYLTQDVETDEIPAALTASALATEWVKDAAPNQATFASLSDWWKEHRPELQRSGVALKAFRSGLRVKASDRTPVTANLRELKKGGLTDWMQEEDADLLIEEQIVEVDVAYEVSSAADGTTKKQQVIERITAQIVATNAQTKTYRQLSEASFTEGEEVPTGLEQALYDGLHALQWEGEIPLVELEASAWPTPGYAINLAGGAAAWASMGAVVQARTTRIASGQTTISLGPPTDLSAAGLVDIYRTNRNRRPSTSYLVRATGRTGGETGGGGSPLPIAQPIKPSQPSTRVVPRVYAQAITVTAVVPTAAEIATAMQTVFTAANPPIAGDIVNLSVSGVVKLRATVSGHGTSAGLFVVPFVVDGTTYYANTTQTGVY